MDDRSQQPSDRDLPNPYAPPQSTDRLAPIDRGQRAPMGIASRLVRWTVICGVSAIPSFLWGYTLRHEAPCIAGMILGTLLFAVAYTVFDLAKLRVWCEKNPALRRAVFIGFGIRVTASAIFPLGAMHDVFPGMISVRLIDALLPEVGDSYLLTAFGLTTVVQGLLLNIELWCVILVIYGLSLGFGRATKL